MARKAAYPGLQLFHAVGVEEVAPQMPLSKRAKWMIGVVAVVAAICVALPIMALIGLSLLDRYDNRNIRRESSSTQTTELPLVTASDLVAAYEANEVAADQRYKNQRFVLTGTVETIGKGLFDSPYVVLHGGLVIGAQCVFDKEAGLASLEKGQTVVLVGTGAGKFGNVMLRGCELH